jgi:MarR family transcriptional regulator, lower aerobic nicotinate degradation pathway regulator
MDHDDPGARAEYDPPDRLRRLPTWLTSEVARRGQRLVNDALAQEGVRRQHFSVLASLADQGPASQAALGRRLWIDRSDLHGLLNELERDGLVARVRDAEDRRRNVVTLTPAGAGALERLDARVQAAQRTLLQPLSAGDRRELRRLLERLVADTGESGS